MNRATKEIGFKFAAACEGHSVSDVFNALGTFISFLFTDEQMGEPEKEEFLRRCLADSDLMPRDSFVETRQ